MNFRIAFFLARSGLRESLFSTGLMIVAIAIGIGFQVPSTANLQGYRAELLAQSLDAGFGDVRVRPRRGPYLHDAEALASRLSRLPRVSEATPVVGAVALATANGHSGSLTVVGVEARALHHPYRVVSGEPLDDSNDAVLLGVSLADRLGVHVGERLEVRVLLSTYPRLVLDDDGYGDYSLLVRGLVGFGASDTAFVSRSFLAGELGDEHLASAVLIHTPNHEDASTVAFDAAHVVPNLLVRAWVDDSPYLQSSVRAVETLTRASWAMGVLAVGIPVLALLYISTLNRRRQIGLLTAMGFSRLDLFTTFLLQALILGFAGAISGGLVAVGLVRYLIRHPVFNWQAFVIRPVLSVHDLALTMSVVLLTAVAAGTYPAWRAARLDPSPILRGIE
jgi:ABC-type lipoprotein release transport system permease subunit